MSGPVPEVALGPDVAAAVGLGVLAVERASVRARDPELDAALGEAAARLRAGGAPEEALAATRAMYRRLGLDPTKTRPSSEALLRRIRKGDELPRINTLVDLCNWCSAEFQLPYGLYDLDRIEGDVTLRLGREGEAYAGIRKDAVHVGGRPVLADRLGAFGNPSSDSARTMVTLETVRALVVVYAPRDQAARKLPGVLDVTEARIARHTGGVTCRRAVLVTPPAV